MEFASGSRWTALTRVYSCFQLCAEFSIVVHPKEMETLSNRIKFQEKDENFNCQQLIRVL
jgi:hypothetical protein